jgi:hypothetical protein
MSLKKLAGRVASEYKRFNYTRTYAQEQARKKLWWDDVCRQICPDVFRIFKDHLEIDDFRVECLIVGKSEGTTEGIPAETAYDFQKKLMNTTLKGCIIQISEKLVPIPTAGAQSLLSKAIYFNQGNQLNYIKENDLQIPDENLRLDHEDMKAQVKVLHDNKENMFHGAYIITIWAEDETAMKIAKSHIKGVMRENRILGELPIRRMLETFLTAQPGPDMEEYATIEMFSGLASLISPTINPMSPLAGTGDGVYFGNEVNTGKDVALNFFSEAAPHVIMVGATGSGKLLPLETRIPTPEGWTTMGEIKVGQTLFDEFGKSCHVTNVFDIEQTPELYRFTFDDGTEIDSCKDHLWVTYDAKERVALLKRTKEFREKRKESRNNKDFCTAHRLFMSAIQKRDTNKKLLPIPTGTVRTTQEIVNTLRVGKEQRANHAIRVPGALTLPPKELPIDPYLLGLWLGDGTACKATITNPDEEITKNWNKIKSQKYEYRVPGLQEKLKENNLLNNKHVPTAYLRASYGQRMDLLQGLMDTDGTVNRNSGSVTFDNTNESLVDAVIELACSLGQKPGKKTCSEAYLNGVRHKDCYSVCWTPTEYVFRLERKRKLQKLSTRQTTKFRYIIKAEKIPTRPGRCIMVSSPSKIYLAGDRMIPTHNTFALILLMIRLYLEGRKVMYLTKKRDEHTNYRAIAEYFAPHGGIIEIGPGHHNINPLQIIYDSSMENISREQATGIFDSHKDIFCAFMKSYCGDEYSVNQDSYIDQCLNELYAIKGIKRDDPSTWKDPKAFPVMAELREKMEADYPSLGGHRKGTCEVLISKTYKFSRGGSFDYVNYPTDANFGLRFAVIDIVNVPRGLRDSMNVLITGMLASQVSAATTEGLTIVIDEGGAFLREPQLADMILTGLTQWRSQNTQLIFATQQFGDLEQAKMSEAFMSNTFFKMIFGANMDESVIPFVQHFLHLRPQHVEELKRLKKGQCLLKIRNNYVSVEVTASDNEYNIIKGIKEHIDSNEVKNMALERQYKVKPQYLELSKLHHIIFENWFEGEFSESALMHDGYRKFIPQMVSNPGTTRSWIESSIIVGNRISPPVEGKVITDKKSGQQTSDHYNTAIQLGAHIMDKGFENVKIHHWNDVDVEGWYKGESYAFEYERDGTHSTSDIFEKFSRAKQKYDHVYIVCVTSNKSKVIKAVEPNGTVAFGEKPKNMCTRGSQFDDLINDIITGKSRKNYVSENPPEEENLLDYVEKEPEVEKKMPDNFYFKPIEPDYKIVKVEPEKKIEPVIISKEPTNNVTNKNDNWWEL